jgi:restriction endonuclease S subunit
MSEWVEAKLGEIAEILIGRTPPTKEPRYWAEDLSRPFCTIADMAGGRSIDPRRQGVSELAESEGKAKRVPKGALLMSFKLTIGRVGFASRDLFPNEAIAWIRPVGAQLDDRFLALALESQDLSAGAGRAVKGNTLNSKSLRAICINYPSLPAQRRIVAVISAVDAQIAAMESEGKTLRQALAAGRERFTEIPVRVPLAEHAAKNGIQIGPFGSQLHAHEYTPEGIPVVMPQDLVDGRIVTGKIKRVGLEVAERLIRHKLAAGDIVFPRRGDLSKRAFVTHEHAGWLCGTGCIRFRPRDDVDPRHLFEALSNNATSQWLVEHAVGTTMLNLNTTIVSKIPVPSVQHASALAGACIAIASEERAITREIAASRRVRDDLLNALISQQITVDEAVDKFIETPE